MVNWPRQLYLDDNNSTTTPLAASATFTGSATEVWDFPQLFVTMKASPNVVPDGDASTAAGSLYVDFSPDGTNWDIQIPIYVRNGIFIPQTYVTVERYWRIRYLNDGGASAITDLGLSETASVAVEQTAFRLQGYMVRFGTKELGRTIDQSISGSDPVALNRAVIMGKDIDNNFVNVQVTPRGLLATTEMLRAVSKGNISGQSILHRTARNSDVDTATTPEDIWEGGGQMTYPTSAAVVSVVSTSTNDDGSPAGTGARTIDLEFLNASYVVTNETLTLNGTSAVTTSSTAIRLLDAEVATAGSGAQNAGDITCSIGGNTQAFIGAGNNRSLVSHYTVPANHSASLIRWGVTQRGGASNSVIRLRSRPSGGVWRPEAITALDGSANTIYQADVYGIEFAAQTDIRVSVISVTANNMVFTCSYELLLQDDS